MKKVYLACPYTHKSLKVRRDRFKAVTKVAGELMQLGYNVYSPITHSHVIASVTKLPTSWEYWEKIDKEFMDWCDIMFILTLDGWKESVGINGEINYMKKLNKLIFLINQSCIIEDIVG